MKNDEKVPSPNQLQQQAAFAGVKLSREEIFDLVKRDMRGIHVLLSEILASDVCINALTDVFYKRHVELHSALEHARKEDESNG